MQSRVNINKTEPQAYKAMYALEGYLATTQLTKPQKDLIKEWWRFFLYGRVIFFAWLFFLLVCFRFLINVKR